MKRLAAVALLALFAACASKATSMSEPPPSPTSVVTMRFVTGSALHGGDTVEFVVAAPDGAKHWADPYSLIQRWDGETWVKAATVMTRADRSAVLTQDEARATDAISVPARLRLTVPSADSGHYRMLKRFFGPDGPATSYLEFTID